MALKFRIPLRDMTGGGTTKQTIICPLGYRYHNIKIQEYYAGGTNTIAGACTNITEIRVKVNNRVQRKFSGTQLRDLNLLNGTQYDAVAGEVPNTAPGVTSTLYLAEPWRKDLKTQDSLAWPTTGWGSLTVEVDATNACTLTCWATVDLALPKDPQMITKIMPAVINAGTKVDYTLQDQSGWLTQISLYPDSGGSNVQTVVTLRKGNVPLFDAITAAANKGELTQNDMFPVASGRTAGIFDLVLDSDDTLDSALLLTEARDATMTFEQASASGTVTAFVQRIGFPE